MATPTLEVKGLSDAEIALMVAQIESYANSKEALTQSAVDSIFRGMADVNAFDDIEVKAFAEGAADVIRAVQGNASILTEAYIRNILTIQKILPPVLRVAELTNDLREGIELYQAYMRPFDEFRYLLSKGKPEADAKASMLRRAESLVDTDVNLATRKATQKTLESTPKVTGYRRIIHPEMSRGGSCGLCVVAADRVYYKSELMPIHDRCKCTVLPVTDKSDPGESLNADQIGEYYRQAGGTEGAKLKRVRVSQHGEIGPVLRDADHKFRGPQQVAA